MNYAVDVELGKQLLRWHKYVHMNGYPNDFVLVLTQTSVKDIGKAHKNFEEICKFQNPKNQYPAYWVSLDKTERMVYSDGKVEKVEDIYE